MLSFEDLLNFLSESFLLWNTAQYLLLKRFVWHTGQVTLSLTIIV